MEDFRDRSISRRGQIRKNIKALQGKLKTTRNPFQQSSLAGELGRLEQERMQIDSLFDEPAEVVDEDAPQEQFPLLNRIYQENPELLAKCRHIDRDIRAAILYVSYFDQEFVGMFTIRKMRLDVKYSVERDSFYDLMHQVTRSLKNYRTEADRIAEGSYAKQYESEILKRKVEMQHVVLGEIDWFFRKLRRFAKELLADIEGDRVLCQNPDEPLDYTTMDQERLLRGRTVRDGIDALHEYACEAVDYLDIPEFQQRPV